MGVGGGYFPLLDGNHGGAAQVQGGQRPRRHALVGQREGVGEIFKGGGLLGGEAAGAGGRGRAESGGRQEKFLEVGLAGPARQLQHGGAVGQPFPGPPGLGGRGQRGVAAGVGKSVRGSGQPPAYHRRGAVRAGSAQTGEQGIGLQFGRLTQKILLRRGQHGEQAQVLALPLFLRQPQVLFFAFFHWRNTPLEL